VVENRRGARVPVQLHVLLGEALELGARPTLAEQDDELAPLRKLPEFRGLIEKAKLKQKAVKHAS
jgi:hypothetical protein